ncbi:MAG: flippase-like domain-containing protein [Bacteroidales bacterium]|nr:flippase-like domain-containing protein [Bacteroidales bacterium]
MQKKQVQKVLIFILKTVIVSLSLWYILYKLKQNNISEINFPEFDSYQVLFFAVVILLMPVNWFVETIKWKFLLKNVEKISYSKSLKAVFSGITFAIFTPNRTGELVGRIFVLKKENRAKGVFATATGSLSQMIITILAGVIAGITFLFLYDNKIQNINPNSLLFIKVTAIFVLFLTLFVLFNLRFIEALLNRFNKSEKFIKAIEILTSYKKKELAIVLFLSSLRYFVFSCQFYFLLVLFNVEISFFNSFISVALTYFISSIIPSFTLTEIGIRGSAAIFFIGMFSINIPGIIAATALLWIINLAVPAIIGAGLFYLTKL